MPPVLERSGPAATIHTKSQSETLMVPRFIPKSKRRNMHSSPQSSGNSFPLSWWNWDSLENCQVSASADVKVKTTPSSGLSEDVAPEDLCQDVRDAVRQLSQGLGRRSSIGRTWNLETARMKGVVWSNPSTVWLPGSTCLVVSWSLLKRSPTLQDIEKYLKHFKGYRCIHPKVRENLILPHRRGTWAKLLICHLLDLPPVGADPIPMLVLVSVKDAILGNQRVMAKLNKQLGVSSDTKG